MAETAVTTITTTMAGAGNITLPDGTRSYTIRTSATINFLGTIPGGASFPLDPNIQWGPWGRPDIAGLVLYFNGTGDVSVMAEVGSGR